MTEIQLGGVEYVVDAVGSVDAFERVQVTARVTGVVDRVRFAEGERVAAGATLVEIEPDRYRLARDSAQASLARAQAEQRDAEAGLARREDLESQGLVTKEDLETWRTRSQVAAATAAQAGAALEQARINLRDSTVQSPIAGTIETRTVETGQYVQAGTVLAVLVRREPLLLRFEVPEGEAARLAPGMTARFKVAGVDRTFEAQISHVRGFADEVSRMVPVTAQIRDPERAELRPGAFAEVHVPVGASGGNAVIPQTAVRPTERGFLAFVVEGDVARERVLELGLRTADGRVEVRRGLSPGERLVTRGAEALRDGAKVRVSGGDAPS